MKRLVLSIAIVFVAVAVQAQPGNGFTRRTPEERAARIHQKLDSAFKLDASKLATLDTALTVLFKTQDARMKEIFENAGDDREAMRETMMAERKKFSDAEDEIIKMMLSEEQFTIWKEKILPTMRQQRPGSFGGPQRAGQ
ncbi:MAG: hypothetical protein BWZ05_00270 [Bacteroidetes bacterium ADurb.BinA245]|jgi:hypothetical protein|nr:MAG: hypothetical protein BWZ05_00270 [Bacteroidetes bacterium ADurb.BinA245]HMW67007.1 hypothetical protein [Chitinophagaceae bacterium]HMX76689.1 hypothetical protein [Chitinophagaceae bacterium]HNC39654.1 hypothetical protein [Chitinophagaceae bacterium]HND94617.1 hypothetical protein [Chitinophagaceae bacterium]